MIQQNDQWHPTEEDYFKLEKEYRELENRYIRLFNKYCRKPLQRKKENQTIPCYKCDQRNECEYNVSGKSVVCKISGCKTPDESVQIEFRKNFD